MNSDYLLVVVFVALCCFIESLSTTTTSTTTRKHVSLWIGRAFLLEKDATMMSSRRSSRCKRRPKSQQVLGLLLLFVLLSRTTTASSTAAGTETLIGIVGDDFILMAADSSVLSGSISWMASTVDKISLISDPFPNHLNQSSQQAIAVAAAGAPADTDRMIAMLKAHATICEYEASVGCDVDTIDTNEALSKDALLV
jgi:hypothetical protein